MKDITRRDFLKRSGVLAALSVTPLRALEASGKDLAWSEETEDEAHLRNDVSKLMKETNFRVEYYEGGPIFSAVQRIDYRKIVKFDTPVEKLQEVKGHLDHWEGFAKKYPGEGIILIFSYKASSIRDVSHIGTEPYPYA